MPASTFSATSKPPSEANELTRTEVRKKYSHYEVAYVKLRNGMALLAVLLPVMFVAVSFVQGYSVRPSISSYYAAGDVERNLLVGFLVAVGVLLILYEGYSEKENRVLDASGVFLMGVAFFPSNIESMEIGGHVFNLATVVFGRYEVSVHGVCAVLFFLGIIYVMIFRAADTLKGDPRKEKWMWWYRSVAVAMFLSMAVAVIWQSGQKDGGIAIFLVESFGVWAFGVFWYSKTMEVNPSIGSLLTLKSAAEETKDTAQLKQKVTD